MHTTLAMKTRRRLMAALIIAGGVATPAAIAGPRAGGSEARATPPAVRQGAGPGRPNAPLSEDGSVSTVKTTFVLWEFGVSLAM